VRDDLLDAQAAVDWAVSQFLALTHRINSWLELNVNVVLEDPDPSVPNNVIVAVEKEPMPLVFNVEVGAYINVLRSSLDILASAVANRHGVVEMDEVYFPVAGSASAFVSGNYKGAKFVKGLPSTERAKIENLRPYQGGHELLWPLHHLDIVRKHQRLLILNANPYLFSVSGLGVRQYFTPLATGFMRADNVSQNKVVLGLLRKDAPKYDMKLIPYVAFDEADLIDRKPIDRAFDQFATAVRGIISLFDA